MIRSASRPRPRRVVAGHGQRPAPGQPLVGAEEDEREPGVDGDPPLRRAQRQCRVADHRCDPGGDGGPDRDSVGVVAGGGLQRVEQARAASTSPCSAVVSASIPVMSNFRSRRTGSSVVPCQAGEQGPLGLAQVAERLADVADVPLVNAPGLQAVYAHDRIGGCLALLEQPVRQRAAAVEVDALGVGRPAGVQEAGWPPAPGRGHGPAARRAPAGRSPTRRTSRASRRPR